MLAVWASLGVSHAQPDGPTDALPRYAVEVVVFRQPPMGASVDESPSDQPADFRPRMAWPLRPADTEGLGYERIPAGERRLNQTAERIDARPDFEVLWHSAWIQPGVDAGRAQAVALPPDLTRVGFSGDLRVYRERYLHAEVRLQWQRAPTTYWVMDQSRRMQSGESHYLDHPTLGVIIRVDVRRQSTGAADSRTD
jgi:hypothetical protein